MEEDQEKYLDEAMSVVKQQSFYMKRCLETQNLKEGLKHASNMLCELKTNLLSPKNYFELYMLVFDELSFLRGYF